MHIPISLTCENQTVETHALIDSGVGGLFIDKAFATKSQLPLTPLPAPIPVYNVDGTPNSQGSITHAVHTTLNAVGVDGDSQLLLTTLGNKTVILGLPWLQQQKVVIDWAHNTVEIAETRPEQLAESLSLNEDEVLLAYIKGEPVVGIFQDTSDLPPTTEHRYTAPHNQTPLSLN